MEDRVIRRGTMTYVIRRGTMTCDTCDRPADEYFVRRAFDDFWYVMCISCTHETRFGQLFTPETKTESK